MTVHDDAQRGMQMELRGDSEWGCPAEHMPLLAMPPPAGASWQQGNLVQGELGSESGTPICCPNKNERDNRIRCNYTNHGIAFCSACGLDVNHTPSVLHTTIPLNTQHPVMSMGLAYKPIWAACPGARMYPDGGSICSDGGACDFTKHGKQPFSKTTGLIDEDKIAEVRCNCDEGRFGRACGAGCPGTQAMSDTDPGVACFGEAALARTTRLPCVSRVRIASFLGEGVLMLVDVHRDSASVARSTPAAAIST